MAPVLIVSIPASSQALAALKTAAGSSTPHSGPRAYSDSYSSRTPDVPEPTRINVLAADRAGSARGPGDPAGRGQVRRASAVSAPSNRLA